MDYTVSHCFTFLNFSFSSVTIIFVVKDTVILSLSLSLSPQLAKETRWSVSIITVPPFPQPPPPTVPPFPCRFHGETDTKGAAGGIESTMGDWPPPEVAGAGGGGGGCDGRGGE